MILASHQPNFLPYPGYFYKMYLADVFTFSDGVEFSSGAFTNYNFFNETGSLQKITIPVKEHSIPIKDVHLANWEYTRGKLIKGFSHKYSKAPYSKQVLADLCEVLEADYDTLCELNIAILTLIAQKIGCEAKLLRESNLNVSKGDATQQIKSICLAAKCDRYLSGIGAKAYLDERRLLKSGIKVIWSKYTSLSCDYVLQNESFLGWLMENGYIVPDEWKKDREDLHNG